MKRMIRWLRVIGWLLAEWSRGSWLPTRRNFHRAGGFASWLHLACECCQSAPGNCGLYPLPNCIAPVACEHCGEDCTPKSLTVYGYRVLGGTDPLNFRQSEWDAAPCRCVTCGGFKWRYHGGSTSSFTGFGGITLKQDPSNPCRWIGHGNIDISTEVDSRMFELGEYDLSSVTCTEAAKLIQTIDLKALFHVAVERTADGWTGLVEREDVSGNRYLWFQGQLNAQTDKCITSGGDFTIHHDIASCGCDANDRPYLQRFEDFGGGTHHPFLYVTLCQTVGGCSFCNVCEYMPQVVYSTFTDVSIGSTCVGTSSKFDYLTSDFNGSPLELRLLADFGPPTGALFYRCVWVGPIQRGTVKQYSSSDPTCLGPPISTNDRYLIQPKIRIGSSLGIVSPARYFVTFADSQSTFAFYNRAFLYDESDRIVTGACTSLIEGNFANQDTAEGVSLFGHGGSMQIVSADPNWVNGANEPPDCCAILECTHCKDCGPATKPDCTATSKTCCTPSEVDATVSSVSTVCGSGVCLTSNAPGVYYKITGSTSPNGDYELKNIIGQCTWFDTKPSNWVAYRSAGSPRSTIRYQMTRTSASQWLCEAFLPGSPNIFLFRQTVDTGLLPGKCLLPILSAGNGLAGCDLAAAIKSAGSGGNWSAIALPGGLTTCGLCGGAGETPLTLLITLEGVSVCTDQCDADRYKLIGSTDPNQTVTLSQVSACIWRADVAANYVYHDLEAGTKYELTTMECSLRRNSSTSAGISIIAYDAANRFQLSFVGAVGSASPATFTVAANQCVEWSAGAVTHPSRTCQVIDFGSSSVQAVIGSGGTTALETCPGSLP